MGSTLLLNLSRFDLPCLLFDSFRKGLTELADVTVDGVVLGFGKVRGRMYVSKVELIFFLADLAVVGVGR